MNTTKITNYLDSLKDKGIPSVDMIVMQNHEIIYRHMNGCTDVEQKMPVLKDQRYLMFSMTKIQTMTALMQLVEEGRISLEDEVGKYLPAYRNLKVKHEDGTITDAQNPLLIKYLVSMQSGLDYDLRRPGILRVLEEKGKAATTRELVDSFVESPLDFEPGTHFNYSLSHDVAAAIVEAASGMTFGEYLRTKIWEPLGMNDTFFAKPMNYAVERLAQQYVVNESNKTVPMEPSCDYQLSESYESGGAGLISTTEDYAKLGDALACGGIGGTILADGTLQAGTRILKPETIDIIKTNLLGPDSLNDLVTKMGRTAYGYGVGMQVFMFPEKVGSETHTGIFGWDGAAGSCLQMDTATKTSFVFTMHVRNCGFSYETVHPMLRDLVFG